ncbi:hypothetical protein [Paraflavitalea sp. CAU 1676]|uniref:hypothetical protein n=1 Tax=Paraflavitalea sp. CAU 1676 TaxID=3032598 RepID=UPI0023DAC673|nr:hypothetical protein [Paraflavitalea sp. CAU 1676]MDF2189283.1 hypothetical protein [Paraflavitalea sp. CAU 1676]
MSSRKKTRFRLPFTKKTENGKSEKLSRSTSEASAPSSGRCYQSIVDLPLSKFISAKVDGNLQAIVIEGPVSTERIAQAWQDIEIEYIDAIGSNEQKAEIKLRTQIETLQADLLLAEVSVYQMKRLYHPYFADTLNSILKGNYKFDPDNPEEYSTLLDKCWNRSRSIKINLDLKVIEYQAIEEKIKKQSTGQPYTREYFAKHLITLSDFAGYQLSENMSVFDYCDRLRRLVDYNEEIKNRNENQKMR